MPEFPPHKIRNRFLFRWRFRSLKWFGHNLCARFQPQQRTGHQSLRRHRNFLQFAMKIDKPRRPRIGSLQVALHPNFADQFEEWFSALKTLRPGFEKKSVLPRAANKASYTRRSFEEN